MNICVPEELVNALAEPAAWRRITVSDAVREAIEDWIKAEKEMRDELEMWQHAGVEALRIAEESAE